MILKIVDFFYIKFRFKIFSIVKNYLLSLKAELIYIVEEKDWSIFWDGKYITDYLKGKNLIKAEVTVPFFFAKNKIIHYGSINCFIHGTKIECPKKSNKIIISWFHIVPTDTRLKYIPYLNRLTDIIHTSNSITKSKLVEFGIEEDKIVVIPLGIDLSVFRMYSESEKTAIRKKLKLPLDKIIIGSFQKDGVGWGEGLEPKWAKGPEIFCEVIRMLHEKYDIHILLTGPARGFVKEKLKEYNVKFSYTFLDNYLDIVDYYNSIDLYIITSRAEGGPKAILEAMATGVPIVTTRVGMAPEIIQNGFNGFIADIEDIDQIYQYSTKIIDNNFLKENLRYNGLITIKKYSWEKIVNQYYHKIYKNLLK